MYQPEPPSDSSWQKPTGVPLKSCMHLHVTTGTSSFPPSPAPTPSEHDAHSAYDKQLHYTSHVAKICRYARACWDCTRALHSQCCCENLTLLLLVAYFQLYITASRTPALEPLCSVVIPGAQNTAHGQHSAVAHTPHSPSNLRWGVCLIMHTCQHTCWQQQQ